MPQNDGIANILGALGAGMKGQGLQYQQQQFAEQERQRQIGLQQQQMKQQQDAERARTAFTDAAAGLSRAKAGDFQGVFNLAGHRSKLLEANHPETDRTKTNQILELSGRAAQGDKQAQTQLISELQDAVNIGQDTGILERPKAEMVDPKMVTSRGQFIEKGPSGKLMAKNVQGWIREAKPQVDELKKTLTELKIATEKGKIAKTSQDRDKSQKIAQQKAKSLEFEAANAYDALDNMLVTVDSALAGEGLEKAAGVFSFTPTMGGTEAADFEATLDTLQSQAFLTQVEKMKGMGGLSENEGRKIAQAVGSLSINMSDKKLRSEINKIREGVIKGKARLEIKYGKNPSTPKVTTQAQYDALPPGATYIEDGQEYRKN